MVFITNNASFTRLDPPPFQHPSSDEGNFCLYCRKKELCTATIYPLILPTPSPANVDGKSYLPPPPPTIHSPFSWGPWRNLENNALSSLHKLLLNRLLGEEGKAQLRAPSTHTNTQWPVPQILMQRRQCIVLQIPPWCGLYGTLLSHGCWVVTKVGGGGEMIQRCLTVSPPGWLVEFRIPNFGSPTE